MSHPTLTKPETPPGNYIYNHEPVSYTEQWSQSVLSSARETTQSFITHVSNELPRVKRIAARLGSSALRHTSHVSAVGISWIARRIDRPSISEPAISHHLNQDRVEVPPVIYSEGPRIYDYAEDKDLFDSVEPNIGPDEAYEDYAKLTAKKKRRPPVSPFDPSPSKEQEAELAERARITQENIRNTTTYTGDKKPSKRRLGLFAFMAGVLVVGACVHNISADSNAGKSAITIETAPAVVAQTIPVEVTVRTTTPLTSAAPETTLDQAETTAPKSTAPVITSTETTVNEPAPATLATPVAPTASLPAPEVTPLTAALPTPTPEITTAAEIPPAPAPEAVFAAPDLTLLPSETALQLQEQNPHTFIQAVLDAYNAEYGRAFVWNHQNGMFYEGKHIINLQELGQYNQAAYKLSGTTLIPSTS